MLFTGSRLRRATKVYFRTGGLNLNRREPRSYVYQSYAVSAVSHSLVKFTVCRAEPFAHPHSQQHFRFTARHPIATTPTVARPRALLIVKDEQREFRTRRQGISYDKGRSRLETEPSQFRSVTAIVGNIIWRRNCVPANRYERRKRDLCANLEVSWTPKPCARARNTLSRRRRFDVDLEARSVRETLRNCAELIRTANARVVAVISARDRCR